MNSFCLSLSRCLTSEITSLTKKERKARTPSEGSRLISFSIASPGFGISCPVAEVAAVEESVAVIALVFSVAFGGSRR